MVKKKKKTPSDISFEKSVKFDIKRMKEGEFILDKQHKIRYKKYRFPKWFDKYDIHGKYSNIHFRKRFGRWMNNEERIIVEMYAYSDYKIREISKKAKINYKNISRYLKTLEKKNLILIKDDYRFERMKSGKLKKYNIKEVRLTDKGIKKRKDYLGF